MSTNMPDQQACAQCPNRKDPAPAEWYCTDCAVYLCMTCLSSHKLIPVCQNHNYISREAAQKIDNKNLKSVLSPEEKILMTRSTLKNAVLGARSNAAPWDVRNMAGSFCDVMEAASFVKKIEKLSNDPYRLGIVDHHIWLRHGSGDDVMNGIIVYDQDLKERKTLKWDQITCISTAQQVGPDEVMILTGAGLHVVSTNGKYQYKIMDGAFSDISVNDKEVAVVEFNVNKVVFLCKKNSKWIAEREVEFVDQDTSTKTIQLVRGDSLYIGVLWADRMMKVKKHSGEIVEQFGSGKSSSGVGGFNKPCLCGIDGLDSLFISDTLNDRFQTVDSTTGRFNEIRVRGLGGMRDVVVLADHVYVLHREKIKGGTNCKISKY